MAPCSSILSVSGNRSQDNTCDPLNIILVY